jgi:PAS domain S-box-containing protein
MKAAASKLHRERRGILKAISGSQGPDAALPREYQTIFKNNGKPMVIVDDDTTITLANAEFARLSGYTKKEIEGTKKWTEFVARQDRRQMKEYHLLRKSDPMLAPRCCEFRFVDRRGKIKNVVLTIGQIPGTTKSMASLQDVTDRCQAEVTQRADEERYQTFFEHSRDAVYITTRDGTFVDANRAALDLFGYTREELKKIKARQLYANPDDAWRLQKEVQDKGFAQDFEVRLRKKDGTELDCQFTVTALRGDDGSILEYQGIARDVTERKRAEEELRESEEKYRDIFDAMLEGYFEVDLAGNFTFFNKAVWKFLGYSPEELKGLNYRAFASPEGVQRLFHAFSEVYQTGDPREIDDYEIIKKDGAIGIAEFSVSLLRNSAGEPIGFRGVTRDVTEKRKTREMLHANEERYHDILENIEDSYYETDLAGNYTFFNEATCRHHGRTREELLGMNAKQHASPERVKKLKEIFTKVYKTGIPATGVENEVIRKDGTVKLVEITVSLLHNAVGEPIGFRGISRDVTERKRIDEELRKSEEKYRTILENITEGYFENDLRGNLTFFNDSLPDVYGYSRDELLNMNYRQFMDEENARKVSQAYNNVYTTGRPNKGIQFEIIRKDGSKRYLENSVSLMRDATNQPVGFRGLSRDITERKKSEEALRENEEKYRTMLENIGDAYTETDLVGRVTFFNKAVSVSLGYTEEEFVGMHYKQYTAPESMEKIYEIYNKVYKTGETAKGVELTYIAKDGSRKILESTIDLMRDRSGKTTGFKTFTNNITEKRLAEEALRRSEERYRGILENMQEVYYEVDLAGNYTFINDAFSRHFGYTKEEVIGKKSLQDQNEANAKKTYRAFKELYRTGEPIKALEVELGRKDGTKGTFELSVSLIRDTQGKPIGFRGMTYDITERKRMEDELRKSEERYRGILENMQEAYYETDLDGCLAFVNDALCQHLGYSKEELIGKKSTFFQDETNSQKIAQAFTEIYRTGEPVKTLEAEYIRKDGTKGTYELSASLRRDAQGKPIGFGGVSRDVNERKEAEEALRQSEEKYRTILENMQEAYYEIDLSGNFILVNDKICKDLGYTKEELIGTNSKQYRDKKNEEQIYQLYNEIYKTGNPIKALEIEYTHKDGTKRIYEMSASLIRDIEGKPIGFRGVSRDINERKKAEEAQQLRLRQLAALSRASQAVTATLELDDVLKEVISLANEAAVSDYTSVVLVDESGHFTRSADNVPGIPSIERRVREKGFTHWIMHSRKALILDEIGQDGAIISPLDLDEGVPRSADMNLVKAGIKSLAGLPLIAKNRLLGVLYLHGTHAGVFNGQLDLLTTFANQAAIAVENARLFEEEQHELAERKKAEERLLRYAAELERSNEEVKNFAYIVSHDLRVPLVNLKGYTSELRSALGVIGDNFEAALPHLIDEKRSTVAMALHEDVPEALEFIANSVSRMDSFINAILILSRLGRQDLKPEPLDVNALVQAALESMSHQIKEQGIEVQVESLPQVVADRTAMERIIGNILSNAVKYVDPERPCRIEVAAETNNGETIFTIRDTGRGIAKEDMHKVFAPFRRAGKQDTQGEGMGLSYVQTLVRRHGGRIWCESELGKGTTFTFTIATTFKQGVSDV